MQYDFLHKIMTCLMQSPRYLPRQKTSIRSSAVWIDRIIIIWFEIQIVSMPPNMLIKWACLLCVYLNHLNYLDKVKVCIRLNLNLNALLWINKLTKQCFAWAKIKQFVHFIYLHLTSYNPAIFWFPFWSIYSIGIFVILSEFTLSSL